MADPPRAPDPGSAAASRGAGLLLLAPLGGLIYLVLPWMSGRMRIGGDIATFLLPVRAFYSESLARGSLPLWDPHLFCGFPLHAEGQTGVLHPLHLLLYRLLPVHWALQAELVAVVALGFFGAHLLARALGASRLGAAFAASVFPLSGFCLAHYVHLPLVAVWAHTPLLCVAALRVGRATGWRSGSRSAALLAAGIASQLLLGSPPATVLSAMVWAVFLFAGLRAGADPPAGADRTAGTIRPAAGGRTRGRRAAAGLAAAAVVTAALIGAAQWVPTLAFLPTTDRGDAEASWSGSFSLHPWNLLQLVAPYAYRGLSVGDPIAGDNRVELAVYPGFGLILLAVAAFLAGRERPPGAPAPAAIVPAPLLAGAAVVAAVLMMGRYGGLANLMAHVPVLSGFRSPVRHAAVFQFFLLALALGGIRNLETDAAAGTRFRRLCLAAAAVVVVAHAAAWPLGSVPQPAAAATVVLSAVTLLVLCGLGALAGQPRRRARFLPLFLFAAALDVVAFGCVAGPGAVPQREIRSIESDLARRGEAPTLLRVIAPWNREVLAGFRNAIGYAALEPRLPERFDLASFSVARIQDSRTGAWRDLPGALPRIRILADAPSELHVARDGAMEQEIVTACDAPHVLVVGDRYDPDWTCTVDGRPAVVDRYLDALRAVRLDAGSHTVRFAYRPASFRTGLVLSAAGVLALLALAWPGRQSSSSWSAAPGPAASPWP